MKTDGLGHYILDVSIENVKCFGKKQTISFSTKDGIPQKWTVILGDNGVGKTTLLKCIASICPSPKNVFSNNRASELIPGIYDWNTVWDTRRLLGESNSKIECTVIMANSFKKLYKERIIQLRLDQNHSRFKNITYNEDDFGMLENLLCVAYGANRKMSNPSFSKDIFTTASISLFDEDAPLINVEEFYIRADYEAKTTKNSIARIQRDKIKSLLVAILPDVSDIRIAKSNEFNRGIEFKTFYGWVKLNEMSLGYKTLISWVVDFASRMYYYFNDRINPLSEPAIVLIDEIDLHLHPKWQRKIMGYLSKIFINTQFIATAHSPLMALEASNSNLILLKRRGAEVVVENDPEVVNTWRIDQLLTSDIFGLSSSRSNEMEKLIKTRRDLLLKTQLTSEDKKILNEIESKFDFIPVAETQEMIEAMEIIKKASFKLK